MTDSTQILNLKELNKKVAHSLWVLHASMPPDSRLIWPVTRAGGTRISEQESKILFCHHLDQSPWFYSIETPTLETYVQSGRTPISGRIDITLYSDQSSSTRQVNIELKAHNQPSENIRKDLEKLVRERLTGVWFHTLTSSTRRTIPVLFKKFVESFDALRPNFSETPQQILFGFCVLKHAQLIQGLLTLDGSSDDRMRSVSDFFADYRSSHWYVYDIGEF